MWVLNLSLESKKLFFGSLALKHKVALFGCPLSFTHNKEAFLKDFKNHPRVLAVESDTDFIVASYKTSKVFSWLSHSHLVHAAHLSIGFDCKETLVVESFQKLPLLFLLAFMKTRYDASLFL